MAFAAALLVFLLPSVALAQPDEDTDPGYRTYETTGTARAATDKPAAQVEAEERQFRELSAACSSGDVAACGELGGAYELGIGTLQVRPIAAILFNEACAAGVASSCLRSGMLNLASEDEAAADDALRDLEKACDLGSAGGCVELAITYKERTVVEQDLARAEAYLRAPCATGYPRACRELALLLMGDERGVDALGEAVGLLDTHCRLGDRESCQQLGYLFERSHVPVALPREAQVLYHGCSAGEASHCKLLGDRAYMGVGVVQDIAYAFAAYYRACALDEYLCETAATMRDVPQVSERCSAGQPAACARMGEIVASKDLIFFNPDAAADYLAFACRNGAVSACTGAGQAALALAVTPQSLRAQDAREFLDAGCLAGDMSACSTLADSLYYGGKMGTDPERALEYYALLCADDRDTDCKMLENRVLDDPDAPLPEAGSNFLPPDDPETGESPKAERIAEMFAQGEERCAHNTLEFRGREYSDTICDTKVRVVRGRSLRAGDAPWQALIWRPERLRGIGELSVDGRLLCGGSVIARGWVLTAAHCVVDQGRSIVGRGYTVRLGVHNPEADEGITYPIRTAYFHDDYDPSDKAYDVALIRYDEMRGVSAATANPVGTIRIDRLPVEQRPINAGMPVYVYGWGLTDRNARDIATELQSARMELTSRDRCNQITGYARYDARNPDGTRKTDAALCALGRNRESACNGDSGGPLIFYGDADRRPRVVGVVSGGRACGQTGEAGKYARIGKVYPWIRRIMSDNP